MEDFIFGTLSTDPLRLMYHRAEQSGIQHAYRMKPQDPKPGDEVTLTVETGPDILVDQLACYYTTNGDDPRGTRGEAAIGNCLRFELVDITWDTLVWGYKKKWAAQLPPQPEGTEVRYIISGWARDGQEIFADWPDLKSTVEHAAKHYFDTRTLPPMKYWGDPSTPRIFSYHVDNFRPPLWAKEAVIYHIFVDRFHPGYGKKWLQTKNPKKAYGGTIWGVVDQLDYIHSLGATAIWLSPIFPSPSIHRYDATDYYHVTEALGGDESLRALVNKAHDKGIRIILDLVCNHISNQHPYFLEAIKNPESSYRSWFYFDDEEAIGYRTFFGVRSMPQVNLQNTDAKQWMLDIAQYWLEEYNVDGYRLDHANGPGPGFWGDFWQTCKKVKPDSITFGEVVEPPYVQAQYFGRMDGLLDFQVCEAIRRGVGVGDWTQGRLESFISAHKDYFKQDFLMATFIDNHDMNRFLYIADNDIGKLKRAAEIQFELPGPPIIYYGTEIGLEQTANKSSSVGLEASRIAMVWDERQDSDLFSFYQELIKKRKEQKPWK